LTIAVSCQRVKDNMQDFRKLKVWEKSHNLTLEIYKSTESFPTTEIYGLTSQIRRSCVSIPANIAEGCGRKSDAEFARFLQIAMGSASELEYHLLLARDLQFLKNSDYKKLDQGTVEVKQMLATLIKKLKTEN
jgi:four helix bundle protein